MVDITTREFKANPYPFYAELRANTPVYRTQLPDKRPIWLVTRYDDVVKLLKDERFVKDRHNAMTPEQLKKQPWVPSILKPLMSNLLDLDAPDHTRLRALVHKAFTPRLVEQMAGRVQAISDDLLNRVEAKGRMDLISDFAFPVPITVISEILGVPAADQGKFKHWSNAIVQVFSTATMLRALPSIYLFMRYLKHQFKARRQNPKDDLITALVQAEESGDKLNEDELLSMVFILLIAGHETTVNLIGNGTLALLQHPDQLEKLRRQPELVKTAVEELLRYSSPVHMSTERYAREDVTLHGITIPRGDMVVGVLASANRDESQFPNPDALDITRENNKHVAFGQGVHYCVGAPLARLEGQIALTALIQRMPNLELAIQPDKLRWRPGLFLRGLESLPVQFLTKGLIQKNPSMEIGA